MKYLNYQPAPKGKVWCKCGNPSCVRDFLARIADRKRGWGLFCSKSCKASEQEKRKAVIKYLKV